jgi:hypothetical protein
MLREIYGTSVFRIAVWKTVLKWKVLRSATSTQVSWYFFCLPEKCCMVSDFRVAALWILRSFPILNLQTFIFLFERSRFFFSNSGIQWELRNKNSANLDWSNYLSPFWSLYLQTGPTRKTNGEDWVGLNKAIFFLPSYWNKASLTSSMTSLFSRSSSAFRIYPRENIWASIWCNWQCVVK